MTMVGAFCLGVVVWGLIAIPFWVRTLELRGNRRRRDQAEVWASRFYERSDERRQALDLVFAINKAVTLIQIAELKPSTDFTKDLGLNEWERKSIRFRYLEVGTRDVDTKSWMAIQSIDEMVRFLSREE